MDCALYLLNIARPEARRYQHSMHAVKFNVVTDVGKRPDGELQDKYGFVCAHTVPLMTAVLMAALVVGVCNSRGLQAKHHLDWFAQSVTI